MSTASDATKSGKLRLGGSNLWLFLLLASMILFGVSAYDVVSHARGVSVTVDEADGKSRSARAFACTATW